MKTFAIFLLFSLVASSAVAFRFKRETQPEAAPAETEATEVSGPQQNTSEIHEICRNCPNITLQHYKAKGCTPVMETEIDKCCPTHWNCPSDTERGVQPNQCFYHNKTYNLGEKVPVSDPCRRGCECKKSIIEGESVRIECAIVECLSSYNPARPGCRPIFHNDECCEVDLECSDIVSEAEVITSNLTIREADCFAEGLEYFLGDKIFFRKDPCQKCVCTEQFSGAYGPGCSTVDCGMVYRDQHYLRDGCTPLYLSGSCCPTDWVCPESPQVIFNAEKQAKGNEDKKTHCFLGKNVGKKGDYLDMYDCLISCHCVTPPDFTCVQYPSCAQAIVAVNQGEAP